MQGNVCILPWMSLAANTTGTTRPCCISEEIVLQSDGTPYNLAKHGLMEIYNSDHMRNLRQEFIGGNKPVGCRRCWNEEAAGKRSKRQMHWHKMKDLLPFLKFDNLDPKHFLYLDLKLGNICNLKCRICGPMISSSWAAESLMEVPKEERATHQSKTWLVEGNWPRDNPAFWEEVHQLIPKIKYLDFTGGEPFLIQEHFDLLKYSVDKGSSKYQMLYYNTNATLYPEQGEELWKHFKKIEMAFSVDNLGPRFELERSGAKWDKVVENIRQFKDMQTRLPQLELHLCLTVNIQNVYYLEEICQWITEQNFDYEHFNLVHDPMWASVGGLPHRVSPIIIDRLTAGNFSPKHRVEIDRIIQFIRNGPGRDGKRFREQMKRMDKLRNENFAETHPEIAELMKYDIT